MSYTIEYNPEKKDRYPMTVRRQRRISLFSILMLILFILSVILQNDISGIRTYWFETLETLADRVREGTGIGKSIVACINELYG